MAEPLGIGDKAAALELALEHVGAWKERIQTIANVLTEVRDHERDKIKTEITTIEKELRDRGVHDLADKIKKLLS